jgi:toxin ParE1/3/4
VRIVHKTGLATLDIVELTEYYRDRAGYLVAMRFVDNTERAFERLLGMPKIGALLGLDELPYADIRHWHIDGFERLLILYRETADGIEVIRVLHSARDIAAILAENPL